MGNKFKLDGNGKTVGIIMGSISDYSVMKDAVDMLEKFGVDYEVNVVSAHRTPKDLVEYAERAIERGVKVIIAGAGGAAHLPGMVASMTVVPVIGVPVKTRSLDGMDSLLSIVQMPKGVPVATVAINGAANAAILASQIVGLSNKDVQNNLLAYKNEMEDMVVESRKEL